MARTRRQFRFTLAHSMVGIAALAVMFAFLPMGPAIAVASLIGCLILLELSRLSNPRSRVRQEVAGLLSSVLGFLCGAILGVLSADFVLPDWRYAVIANAFWCGLYGSVVAGARPRDCSGVNDRRGNRA